VTAYAGLVLSVAWSAAVAAAVVVLPVQPWMGALAAGAALPIAAVAFVLRPALVALAVAAAMLGVARVDLAAPDPSTPTRAVALAGDVATLTARVVDDARAVGGGGEVVVEPIALRVDGTRVTGVGNLLVRWRGPADAAFGDLVDAAGRLALPRDAPDFDRRAYLAQQQVYLEVDTTSFGVVSSSAGIFALPSWLRVRYTAILDQVLPAPHAAVLLGIVLGIRQGIPTRLEQALIATGLVHLLVLSGLKVAVFARIVQAALKPLLGRLATWPALALIGLYALAGGATPAAVRAAAMGGLVLAASHLGRPAHVWTSMAVTAAAMLGWRPDLAWDVGFQLSFAGTAAIVLLTPSIARRVAFLPEPVREPFAVTCAAQVGTLPMMAADFHVLSPSGPIANAITLPLLPVVVAAGLLLGPIGAAMPDIARIAAVPLVGLLAYVEQVAYVLSRVPLAAIAIPTFPAWAGAAYYSAIAPAVAGLRVRGRRRGLALVAAVASPAAICSAALIAWSNAPPQAIVLDVGDGQAVLLRGPQGAILIDGGPSPERLAAALGTELPPWQSGLEALVITAPGLGHVGGLAGFDRTAATVVVPDAPISGSAWRTAALEQVARGAAVRTARAGRQLTIAGWRLELLAPEPGAPAEVTGAADIAFRAVAPSGRSFCDFSDLDLDGQLGAAARLHGTCTALLLPNRGASTLAPELERAATDRTTRLIASRGAGRLAQGFGPAVLRTDEEGTIAVPL
jgi:competence protein ComEC